MSNNDILKKTTYSKLSSDQIEKMQAKYGDNDPKFIENIKKPGGKIAGEVDLYSNDQIGEIVIRKKNQDSSSEGGETTGYNIKDIK